MGVIRFRSVGVKLFAILFVTIVGLSSALGFASYSQAKRLITDKVAAASQQSIVQAGDKLDFLLAEYEALSRQFAVDGVLKQDIALIHRPGTGTVERTAAEGRIRKKLDAVKSADERLLGVRLVAKSLAEPESYKSGGVSGVRTDDAVKARIAKIEAAKGNPVWFPVLPKGFFDAYGEPSMTMGRLLRNMQKPDEEYYMLIEIKSSALTQVLSNLHIGDSGHVRMLDTDGTVVYAAETELLGQPADIRPPAGSADTAPHSFKADDGLGEPQLGVYQPLRAGSWTLVGHAPIRDFTQEADRLLYLTLAVLLASVLIAGLIGLLLVRMVGRPISQLAMLMEEGEQGNLLVRTNFRSRDEIGRLGHSFNRMMERIALLTRQSGTAADAVLATSDELARVSRTTSSTAGEVAAATREIAAGAERLGEEAEQSIMSVEAMGARTEEVVRQNEAIDHAAVRVVNISDGAAERMEELVRRSETAAAVMDSIQSTADQLKQSAGQIYNILTPLVAVTKQTHILALNASIEAARAGASGRGFGVIAGEIRGLAAQSGDSIRSVSEMTESIQREIETTVRAVNEAAPLFREQIESVRETAEAFAEVKAEMERTARGIAESSAAAAGMLETQRQLAESLEGVGAIVEQTGASTREVAGMSSKQFSVSEELVALSGRLEELAGQLRESLKGFRA